MLLAEAGTDSVPLPVVLPQASAQREVQFVADRDVASSYVDPVGAAAAVVAAVVVDPLDGTVQGDCLLAPADGTPHALGRDTSCCEGGRPHPGGGCCSCCSRCCCCCCCCCCDVSSGRAVSPMGWFQPPCRDSRHEESSSDNFAVLCSSSSSSFFSSSTMNPAPDDADTDPSY